jgi:hypothetical protein
MARTDWITITGSGIAASIGNAPISPPNTLNLSGLTHIQNISSPGLLNCAMEFVASSGATYLAMLRSQNTLPENQSRYYQLEIQPGGGGASLGFITISRNTSGSFSEICRSTSKSVFSGASNGWQQWRFLCKNSPDNKIVKLRVELWNGLQYLSFLEGEDQALNRILTTGHVRFGVSDGLQSQWDNIRIYSI